MLQVQAHLPICDTPCPVYVRESGSRHPLTLRVAVTGTKKLTPEQLLDL